jgi:hypothetical protein
VSGVFAIRDSFYFGINKKLNHKIFANGVPSIARNLIMVQILKLRIWLVFIKDDESDFLND